MEPLWQTEFQRRRAAVSATMEKNSVLLWPCAPVRYRNADTAFPYRQDSHFYYLTGFEEADALLVLQQKEAKCTLFCRDHDPERERWEGKSLGIEGALEQLLVQAAYPIEALETHILSLLEGAGVLYYPMGISLQFDQQIQGWLSKLRQKGRNPLEYPRILQDARKLLATQRVIKSPLEIAQLRQAATITAQGFKRIFQRCRSGMYEYALEAELLYMFYQHGARACAYPSIVGGGINACTLHYQSNRDILQDGELVLVDAGCEYQGYASDVTRTFPINGVFTKEQKRLYQLVLDAQVAAIESVKPGIPFSKIQETLVCILSEGLIQQGFLKGPLDKVLAGKEHRQYYPHSCGHWLGLDVHDVGYYEEEGRSVLLRPGMVFTIEPGLYIPSLGIGIRIEDDILVTEQGFENLTQSIPKTITDIEQLMHKGKYEHTL